MKKTFIGTGLLATVVLAFTACGLPTRASSEATSAPVTAQSNSTGTPVTPEIVKPSQSPTASATGLTRTLPYANITVMDSRKVLPTANLPYTFVGFDLKVCATQPMAVTWQGWVLIDSQDRQFTPVQDVNEILKHPLPGSSEHPANLEAGQCARGWILFYNETENEDLDSKTLVFGEGLEGGTVEWSLSK